MEVPTVENISRWTYSVRASLFVPYCRFNGEMSKVGYNQN